MFKFIFCISFLILFTSCQQMRDIENNLQNNYQIGGGGINVGLKAYIASEQIRSLKSWK
jgi:hypothetical protein